jgi:2-keto-3-deoxy-L-rhamnonate aldolase RhmA
MTTLVAWQQLPSPQITSALLSLGFDWIVVDLEHSSITTQEAECIFTVVNQAKKVPFVRLPSADPYLARRMLDGGVKGIMVPVVESKDSFDCFAQHCYFPPKGRRGLGLAQANEWGEKLEEHFHDFKPVIIAQIETKLGASAIEEIISSAFLDGIMIGPFDLSADLGIPKQFDNPSFKNLCNEIFAKTKSSKKMIGFHQVEPDLNKLDEAIQKGYDFIAYGTDIVAMRHALKGIKK